MTKWRVYKTPENEYLPYSNWKHLKLKNKGDCVRHLHGLWLSVDCGTNLRTLCFVYLGQ